MFRVARRSLQIFANALKNVAKTAVVSNNHSFSYGDILYHSERIAKVIGMNKDLKEKCICFMMPYRFEYVATQYAVWRCGAICVPLHISHPLSEIEYYLTNSKCEILIVHKSFSPILSIAEKLRVRVLIVSDMQPEPTASSKISTDVPQIEESRAALMLYTSGTTGRPKGVVTTHSNLRSQAESMIQPWAWSQSDRLLHCLPLHHLHGVMNALYVPLWVGACVEMMGGFNAEAVWNRLLESSSRPASRAISLFFGVPTMYSKLIAEYRRRSPKEQSEMSDSARKLRLMISGSASLPETIWKQWYQISHHCLLERYGMTEIGMGLSQSLDLSLRHIGSVGSPLPGVRCKIVGEDGRECGEDEAGELLVSGPCVFREYFGRPDATAESFVDGYFKTGDVAVLESETKTYRILGRRSVDIIKTAGYKVSALDVERVLLEHEQIEEVCVFGIPDDTYGEVVAALIVPKANSSETIELKSLRAWFCERGPSYRAPSIIKVVSELPKNAMGKVNKKQLREAFQKN